MAAEQQGNGNQEEDGAAASDDGSRETYDLGIVFVHGIGEQKESEYLRSGADALAYWLKTARLFPESADDGSSPAEPLLSGMVRHKDLQPAQGHPFVELDLVCLEPGVQPNGDEGELEKEGARQRWLLTEAWWADVFEPPSYTDFAYWTVTILPWTVASHFMKRFVLQYRRGRSLTGVRTFDELLYAALAMVSVPVVYLALLVFGLVPGMQRILTGTVGDSFMLIANEANRERILETVEGRIEETARRCERTCVIAHSQGAAIAHDIAKRDRFPDNVELLITFGAGTEKLVKLRSYLAGYWNRAWHSVRATFLVAVFAMVSIATVVPGGNWWVALINPVLMLTAIAIYIKIWTVATLQYGDAELDLEMQEIMGLVRQTGLLALLLFAGIAISTSILSDGWSWPLLAAITGSCLVTVVLAGLSREFAYLAAFGGPRNSEPYRQMHEGVGLRVNTWADLYSSADPVPNGVLFPGLEEPRPLDRSSKWPWSVEICNLRSLILDHTAYWANRDEFVTYVMALLVRTSGSGSGILVNRLLARAGQAGLQRKSRVARRLTFLLVPIAVAVAGIICLAAGFDAPLWQWLSGRLGGFPYLQQILDLVPPALVLLFKVAVVFLAAFLIYRPLVGAWDRWNIEEMRKVLEKDRADTVD